MPLLSLAVALLGSVGGTAGTGIGTGCATDPPLGFVAPDALAVSDEPGTSICLGLEASGAVDGSASWLCSESCPTAGLMFATGAGDGRVI